MIIHTLQVHKVLYFSFKVMATRQKDSVQVKYDQNRIHFQRTFNNPDSFY